MKDFRTWTRISSVLMLITAVLHSLSFFVTPVPANETERQLIALTTSYRIDAGAGFHPTYSDINLALSFCFTAVCALGGLTLFFLARRNAAPDLMRGVLLIHLLVFGSVFAMMAFFTFLPPIVCTALIAAGLLAAFLLVPKDAAAGV
jgi:hypothetical protein